MHLLAPLNERTLGVVSFLRRFGSRRRTHRSGQDEDCRSPADGRNTMSRSSARRLFLAKTPVVRQTVVHHIKRISFSLAEVLRFGIACGFLDPRKCSQRTWTVPGRVSKTNLALRRIALESMLPPPNDGAGHRVSERIESSFLAQSEFL